MLANVQLTNGSLKKFPENSVVERIFLKIHERTERTVNLKKNNGKWNRYHDILNYTLILMGMLIII